MKNVGLIAVILLLASPSSYGAALGQSADMQNKPHDEQKKPPDKRGLSENTARLGYSIGFTSITVDDPDGKTNKTSALQPVTLIYTNQKWDSLRYWSEFYYYKATLDAKPNKIGQDVQRYGFRLSLQKRLLRTAQSSIWMGGGMDISNAVYTARHSIDSSGFLIDVYPKREEIRPAAIVNILGEWMIKPEWAIGVKLEQSFSGGEHIEEFLSAVTVLYQY